jgi:hypothetical protein
VAKVVFDSFMGNAMLVLEIVKIPTQFGFPAVKIRNRIVFKISLLMINCLKDHEKVKTYWWSDPYAKR